MGTLATINLPIDHDTEVRANRVLAAMGLTLTDVVTSLLRRTADEGELPFDPLIPNEDTIAALEEAERGDLPSVSTVEELAARLYEED